MTCTNSILAGSNSSNDNPFDCRSHGGVRRHIWIYTTNHIGIMHDDVSILCTCIKGFRERHKCKQIFWCILIIVCLSWSRTDGRAQCGLWMFSCVSSAIVSTTVLVFSIRRTLKLLLTYQGRSQLFTTNEWTLIYEILWIYHITFRRIELYFSFTRLDVHVARRIEKTTLILQDMGTLGPQSEFIIYIRTQKYKHRKSYALFLPRCITIITCTTRQENTGTVSINILK